MKQENINSSPYAKLKRTLYEKVEADEKQKKIKMALIVVGALIIAGILIFTASLVETNGGKYTYIYGDYEQKISKDQAVYNDIQLIDMNALADFLHFEKKPSGSQVEYKINGTVATFYNAQNTAIINGIEIRMPTNAMIKNGYCLIPLSTACELLYGVEISVKGTNANISQSGDKVFMLVNNPETKYQTNISQYLEYINSKDEYIFTLVNKQNPVDKSFPEDKDSLIEIPAKYRKSEIIYLYIVAEKALEAMMNDMFELGFTDTYVTSAYRRYDKQQQLIDKYVQEFMAQGMSYNQALEKVMEDTALPGQSEHQTGLCVDFMTRSMSNLDNSFAETDVFEWLKENSWKYGFIIRFPEDKTNITGYSYESWHYRFVGFERASIMYQTGLCYEEYLEIFGDK